MKQFIISHVPFPPAPGIHHFTLCKWQSEFDNSRDLIHVESYSIFILQLVYFT